MQLTQQIRIKPTTEQTEILWILSEKCRLIYNFALKERITAWKFDNNFVSYNKQQNDLPKIKEQYPKYKWVYSKVLQQVLRMLDADYKSFYKLRKNGHKDAKPPRFKGSTYFTTMIHNQSGFKYNNGKIKLSHKYNDLPLEFNIPTKFIFDKIYQVTIYLKDDDFYLSVLYEEQIKPYVDNKLYQAFDLGATKQTAVNTNGKFIEITNVRSDKYWEKPLKELQSRRDHCKKYSRRWKQLNKLYNKCKRKSANQLKDWQHKTSKKIVDNTKANTIIVGKLEVKKLSGMNKYEKGLHKSMHNTGNIGRLVRFLTYKAKRQGKRVIEINERGTTRTCCCCGKQHNMPLYKRVMKCDCGNVIDRDKNSAINIMLRYLSQNGLWIAYQLFVGNLRKTGISIQVLYS
jgi:putative transposase